MAYRIALFPMTSSVTFKVIHNFTYFKFFQMRFCRSWQDLNWLQYDTVD